MSNPAHLWDWAEPRVQSPTGVDRPSGTTATVAHDRACKTCGDPLKGDHGTFCPRCQWSEDNANLDHDPLSNPPDPFVDLNLGITPKAGGWQDDFMDRMDQIPGVRYVDPIPNHELGYEPGDRVTRQYANPAPRSTYGLPGEGHICPNTGTVVGVRDPGEHFIYADDPEGGFHVDHDVPSYDVRWDLGASPDFTSYYEPGRTGEAIPQHELWPEGHENTFKSLVSPKAPDVPPEHWGSRLIPSHRHARWFEAVDDL